LIQEQIVRCSC